MTDRDKSGQTMTKNVKTFVYLLNQRLKLMAFDGFSTLKVIAEELEISKRAIFRLEEEGKIHFRRIKGKIYVKRAELIDLLEQSCKGCK
jgi:hypothetical protein